MHRSVHLPYFYVLIIGLSRTICLWYNFEVKNSLSWQVPFLYLAVGLGVAALAAAGYFSHELSTTRSEFASSTIAYEAKVHDFESQLTELNANLQSAVDLNARYAEELGSLVSTVSTFEKLSRTDKELLQKYSSVFFLSENFVPSLLVPIHTELLFKKDSNLQIHSNIKTQLENMMRNATAQGAPILVLSSYRSFGTQAGLKAGYSVTYGKGTANQFSADQGYSEHQLGSAVDFTTPSDNGNLDAFEKSPGFAWLQQHAHEYGFTLSYQKGNKFFQYEPWHWRFVGVQLATKLKNEGKTFYDLDQREINEYLVTIFD